MKTTVELSEGIFRQVKDLARRDKTTIRQILESALGLYLREKDRNEPEYRYQSNSFKGEGVYEGVYEGIQEGKWDTIRSLIYEGRGG